MLCEMKRVRENQKYLLNPALNMDDIKFYHYKSDQKIEI